MNSYRLWSRFHRKTASKPVRILIILCEISAIPISGNAHTSKPHEAVKILTGFGAVFIEKRLQSKQRF